MSWRSGRLPKRARGKLLILRASIHNNSHLIYEVGSAFVGGDIRLDFYSSRPPANGASTRMWLTPADAEVVVAALLKGLEEAREANHS